MKNRVYQTASVVTGLSVAERALGFLYRILLSRLIGAEGLGLYQVALSLFSVFLTIGAGGIPISVSRLISKSKAENDALGERSAFSAGAALCLLLTLPVAIVFGIFAPRMNFLFSDARCAGVFRILLIGLIFSSLYAVIRGYFWGNKEFLIPSVLEIAEESVMVIAGVLLLQNVSTPESGAHLAAWAVVLSYLFSFTASTLCFFFKNGKISSPKKMLKPLFNASLPITSVRVSGSLVNSAIAVLLPVALIRAGASESEAMRLFGIVSGMAIPILFIPSTVIGSLSLVLVPELSEDFYRKNKQRLYKNLRRGLRVSFMIACMLIPMFFVLGDDLGEIAFSNATAGEIITRSCPILLTMSLKMITTGMLNSMGFEKKTFAYYFIGAAVMLASILLLPRYCGVYAYVIGLGASYLINAVCNLKLLGKECPELFQKDDKASLRKMGFALAAILPVSLIGLSFQALFSKIFGELVCAIAVGIVMAIATVSVYFLCGLLPKKSKKRT